MIINITVKPRKKYIVYKTTNLINAHFYIGIHGTYTPYEFDNYLANGIKINAPSSYKNPTTPMQYAVNKYGIENFKRETLYVYNTLKEALDKEAEIVNKEFIKRKDTYNVALGGNMATHFTPIFQFDVKGNLLKKWDSIIDVSDEFGITSGAVCNAARYKGSCNGFLWSKEDKINIAEYSVRSNTPVYKYNSKGEYIESYWSCVEAANENNTTKSLIMRACKGDYKVNDAYYSTKLVDIFIPKKSVSLRNKNIYLYDLEGNYLQTFTSRTEACQFFNISLTSNSISTAIRTERQYKGYQLRLEKFDKIDPVAIKTCQSKEVKCYDLEGNLIEIFSSITKAVKKYGTGVQKVLYGQQKQCKGFIFKYS